MWEHENEIPEQFYKESWEDADHPMAAVNIAQQFIRVNFAFERMLGFSNEELRGKTWMEFTRKEHVGGDLASVNAVIAGRTESYQLEKDYVHKRGHFVPIVLTVRRFPRSASNAIALFRVEAPPAVATRPEVLEIEHRALAAVDALRKRIDEYERGVRVQVGDTWRDGDKTGRDKNSDSAIKLMTGALAVMAIVVAWVIYYVSTSTNQNITPVSPPSIQQPNN